MLTFLCFAAIFVALVFVLSFHLFLSFLSIFACALPLVFPGEITFFEPIQFFFFNLSELSALSLGVTLAFAFGLYGFSFGEFPLPLPFWIVSFSTLWQAPTR